MPRRVSSRSGEQAIALALLLIALATIGLAWRMPAGTVSLPGPRVYPTALAALLALVSAVLLLTAARRSRTTEPVPLGHSDAMVTLAVLVVTALVFERIGAAPSFALFLFALLRVLARLAWWQAATAACAGSLVTWAIFTRLLGVKLPAMPI